MAENNENESPHINGSSSEAGVGSSVGNAHPLYGSSAEGSSTSANGLTNGEALISSKPVAPQPGSYGPSSMTPSAPFANGAPSSAITTSATNPAAPNAREGQTPAASNATVGNKSVLVTKRPRPGAGLPPPLYSPLGAASPSLSSNAPSFPTNGNSSGTSSTASSTPPTPSAGVHDANFTIRGQPTMQNPTGQYISPHPSQQPLIPPQHQQTPQSLHQSQGNSGHQQAVSNGAPNNGAPTSSQYPSLYLHPLNETFIPKQILLAPCGPHNRIKIGRQTNAKTVPAPNNGYFDSKVLSRMHAEVWCEGNKVYIKDVKSSNGTFINGERLSQEAVESDVFELHSNDMVEFGIDITSEDGKTIVHHKVAARIYLVMNAEDGVAASRNFSNYYREMGESPLHRRPGLPGSKMNNGGMNLDQVLNRLQTELQKSRETGAELGSLTTMIGEIHETLDGNVPGPPLPAYRVPPYIPPNPNAPPSPQQQHLQAQQQTQQLLSQLQSQLQDTQNALNVHVERIKNLETLLGEQDRMKSELKEVRDRMEDARAELDRLKTSRESTSIDQDDDESSEKDDFDELDLDNAKPAWQGPQSVDRYTKTEDSNASGSDEASSRDIETLLAVQNRMDEEQVSLVERVDAMSAEFSKAFQLSSSLRTEHGEAASTIRALESKVSELERALQRQTEAATQAHSPPEADDIATSASLLTRDDILKEIETKFSIWKKTFEDAAQKERQSWEEERERLRLNMQEWKQRSAPVPSTSAAPLRKKRRSKASTVSTASTDESSTLSEHEHSDDPGFTSPVTDDSGGLAQEKSDYASDMPKRPRSRRRRRAPDSISAGSSGSARDVSESRDTISAPTGGSAITRRQSWIPFGRSLSNMHEAGVPARASDKHKLPRSLKGSDSSILEHPALPIVSAAGIVVIGYLAYATIMQHQK